jgi:hypothetical protein
MEEDMETQETILDLVRDFLRSNPPSRLIRWAMVLLLLFNGIPQKTVASITNYTDRQVRNIRDQFENSNGDFPPEGKKEKRTVHVNYAGGWLLAPFIVDIVNKTRQAFDGLPGSVEAILTLLFLSVFGIERPFHLEGLSDPGFAILTGRNGVLSRTTLFRWMKGCRKSFVICFYDLTRPSGVFAGKKLKISID